MKFGILCNGKIFQQWQIEVIRKLISGGHNCALLIVNDNPLPVKNFREKIFHYPYSKLLCRFWFRFMIKPKAKNPANIADLQVEIPEIHCITNKKGYAEYFGPADLDKIKTYKLDFILRFGFGILKGDILDAAEYGVWSYHHDDDRKYRGVPTGFWEIWFGDPVNAAILQRLTDKLDSGVILRKAFFKTISHSWQANLNNLLQNTTEWPLQVCTDIENGNTSFLEISNSPESKIYRLPNNLKMLCFLVKVAANKFRFHFRDLFFTEKWNIGILPVSVEKLIKPGTYQIPEPEWLNISDKRSIYHADPFGYSFDGKIRIVCEEYGYKTGKGFLTSMEVDEKSLKISGKKTSLEKPYHLAFPYLFDYEGVYYCIPENSEGGNLDLYRFEASEGKLVFERTLIKNLKAVDPVLFEHNGLWWLMFTDKISTNERLHIWYADDLDGNFKPHANNPVKTDVRSSRPAGKPFILDGKLLRPAQDCSIRSGGRIAINHITKLSPTEFIETNYAILNPSKNSKYRDGMHTFCWFHGGVIVDGKQEVFIWQAFTRKLTKKLRIIK